MKHMKEYGFYRGVNLGGWLSQCDYSAERLDTFITKRDIDVIADWGLDHVRIPVDYNVLEKADGSVSNTGFDRLHCAVEWCRADGLNVIIDLHKTPGYSFDMQEKETGFFVQSGYQERFYRLWLEIARHFGSDHTHVAFELLNEVTDKNVISSWNAIAGECVQRIRSVAPYTVILIGSYQFNSAAAVPALDPPADALVCYNFHCYEPISFTHQGAWWVPQLDPKVRIPFAETHLNKQFFEDVFSPALKTAQARNTALYCGEYGVIDTVSPQDTLRWYSMIHDVFEKHQISRCAWTYKQMDFSLSDARLDGIRRELLRML